VERFASFATHHTHPPPIYPQFKQKREASSEMESEGNEEKKNLMKI
jgi:hypothetical protein